jgi:voltage-gated potassium channel
MLSYIGFNLVGETDLLGEGVFPYYYFTTVSTVGYGDISPATDNGRLFFVIFVLPGGLTVFTVVLGKAVGKFSEYFRKKANGMGDFSQVEGATVIVGYHPQRTKKMIAEIKASTNNQDITIVLMSLKDVPRDPDWRFVKAESLSNLDDLKRAAIEQAHQIIVYADTDDLTLTSVLAVRSINKSAHLVCYFTDAEKADLLNNTCDAEIIVSSSVELVARELTDPGSNVVLSDLMSARTGISTFSLSIQNTTNQICRQSFTQYIADTFGATLISVKLASSGNYIYDPRNNDKLNTGDIVYYIGEKRISLNEINWETCQHGTV